MYLKKPQEGKCSECATEHRQEEPHNQQSLYYQYKFYFKHKRWPTWEDALAHCSQEMRDMWVEELEKAGVEFLKQS